MRKILFPVLAISLLIVVGGEDAVGQSSWVSYLYMNDIRDIAVTAEGVWCATSGGVLFFDFAGSEFRTWNRAPGGLGSDSLTTVACLADGRIAFGTSQVGVSLYEPDLGLWYNYNSLTWQIASDAVLFIHEDPPWRLIGSRGGCVALEDGAATLTCQQGLDICGLSGWDVHAGIYHDGYLWFGAQPGEGSLGGISRLSRATGEWEEVGHGLPSLTVTSFAVWQDSLFCGTDSGVAVWTASGWDARSSGLPSGAQVRQLAAGASDLLAAVVGAQGGVFARTPGASAWQRLGEQILQAECVAEGEDGIIWAGAGAAAISAAYLLPAEDGLWEFVGGQWIQHRQGGPHPVQSYWALTQDPSGRLWAASATGGKRWRIGRLQDGHWSFFDSENTALSPTWVFDLRVVGDQVWVGHCCCETEACYANLWSPDDSLVTVYEEVYNIRDSADDDWGNLWFASYFERYEDFPDAVRGLFHREQATGQWRHFDSDTTGGLLISDALSAVAVDGRNLWIGYVSQGVSHCRLRSDGLPPLDARYWTHYSADDAGSPLAGNRVTALASRPGEIWIGTDNGLTFLGADGWWLFQERFDGLPGSEIKDIALTDDGAAWVAVRGAGVTRMTRMPSGSFAFERFGPPDLVSPDVQVLATGSGERDLWVGTSAGLSHYIPRATLPDPPLTELSVYPNPYNPYCGEPVRFVELPGSAERGVVVDTNGQLLARFGRKWSRDPFWDGRDTDGEPVPPGLYIVRVATPQGWLTGQIAVLDLPCEP